MKIINNDVIYLHNLFYGFRSEIKFGSIQNYRYAQFLTRGLEKASIKHDTQVTV